MKRKNYMLIVDDVELNRVLLKEHFKKDFIVVEAKDGKEAYDIIEKYQEEISIILLDIVMPIMDGYEILKKMKEGGLLKKIPVVAVTANDTEKDVEELLEAGVLDTISKPFDPHKVKDCVEKIMKTFVPLS